MKLTKRLMPCAVKHPRRFFFDYWTGVLAKQCHQRSDRLLSQQKSAFRKGGAFYFVETFQRNVFTELIISH
jgi:hypothetical protein